MNLNVSSSLRIGCKAGNAPGGISHVFMPLMINSYQKTGVGANGFLKGKQFIS